MSIINKYEFMKCINPYNSDRLAIKFHCHDQFMVMSFAQFMEQC